MKRDKDTYALSSVRKPDLEDEQWFPKTPAKPSSKWSILIALLDAPFAVIIVFVFIYFLINRI